MPNWRQSTKNTKVELYSEEILWKMILDLMQYSLNSDHQQLKWRLQNHGHYIQTTRMRRTSSRRSICIHPGQNGRCTILVKNSEVRMSRYLDTSTKTQMANIVVQYGRSCRPFAFCRQYTHKHCTYSAVQPVHKRGTHITRLAQGPARLKNCSVIFVRLKRVCHLVRTCLIVAVSLAVHHEHMFFLLHSSFYHDTRTRTTIGNNTPLWRENQQSGGNMHKTFSTGCEPTKELATVSRISRITDPYKLYDAQKEFGERDHRVPIAQEVNEFGSFGNPASKDSKLSATSYFQSHVHTDDSAESVADSDLEDGELQKMRTSHCMPRKLRENPMQWSCRKER